MRRGRAGLGGESPSHPEARPDALPTVFGAQGAADVVLSPVGVCCLQVLTHLHGPDARGGRRRRGGGVDIAVHGGCWARRGAPCLQGLARAHAAAICPRLRPCRRRRGGGSLGGDLAGGWAGEMDDYSFPSRRSTMGLMWCRCSARSSAAKGQTNYTKRGMMYFMIVKCPSRALCSLDRVYIEYTAMPGSGSTTPRWIFSPPARSYVQLSVRSVGAEGHLMHKKCASPTKMDTFHLEQATPCAKAPRQISSMIVPLQEHRQSSTSPAQPPAKSPPKEPPPRRRWQGPQRGLFARGRARASPCRLGAPCRACKPPCAAI